MRERLRKIGIRIGVLAAVVLLAGLSVAVLTIIAAPLLIRAANDIYDVLLQHRVRRFAQTLNAVIPAKAGIQKSDTPE